MTDDVYGIGTKFCWYDEAIYSLFLIGYTHSGRFHPGMLYNDVVIPVGAIINEAHIRFQNSTSSGTAQCKLQANDTITPSIPTTAAGANGLAKTTAYVMLSPSGGSGDYWNSPDMKDIIQELVDSYDYSAGEPMMFAAFDIGGSPTWYHYLNPLNPTLYITYTALGGRKVQVMFV